MPEETGAGDLAIVLHSHMPYVEGFGTYPFGEEWLFDAVIRSYLPLLDVARDLTMTVTPVLADQLEDPGVQARLRDFLVEWRVGAAEADAPEVPPECRAACEGELARYGRALELLDEAGGDPLRPFREAAAGGRVALAASAATHAVLPLLATRAGQRLQIDAGTRSHRRRFGWDGGFWLPECAYSPGLEWRLAEHGVRWFCVDRSAHAPSLEALTPVATEAGPAALPIDWEAVSWLWSLDGYPSDPAHAQFAGKSLRGIRIWKVGGGAYDPQAAARAARRQAHEFLDSIAARLREFAATAGRRGLVVFAIDTELLGHWWSEGVTWLQEVLEGAAAAGVRLLTVPEALAEHEPRRRTLATSSWGEDKDLRTWDSPKVGDIAWAGRRLELRLLRALSSGLPPPAAARAARELLAVQSSDWAFLDGRGEAGDYAFQRVTAHAESALEAIDSPASTEPRMRSLAPDLSLAPLLEPRPVPMATTRVLILSWEYPPLIEGGLARHVRKLSEALIDHDVEVHVLTRGEESPAEERAGGVAIHRIREPKRPTDLGEFVAWVERMNSDMLAAGVELGDRYDFDLVHGHDWLVANACDHLAKRFGAPLVTTIHATEHGRHQGWVDKHPQTYIHGVERWISNRSERVIACSHYMREQIVDIFGVEEERVTVIPNGIDPDDLQPQDPAELLRLRAEFAAPEEKLVLLIGRLVYEKGFQLALEAMPRLIEEAPGTRFLVAGSGTHEAELHKQAEELGLMEHGTFVGWIGDDVLHSLYRIADLTVVPSIYEPFGLVALEAMASGCPCIVADTGGLREVVPHEEAGLRFTAHDPDALADVAVRVLCDDELGRRLVAEAYEHLRRFDWGDVAERTAAVYAELAPARPSADRS